MNMNNLKIGLALSGGGVRAAVFHLGVLKSMAEQNMLENVTYISTVSGASLAIGLVFSINNNIWPTSSEYINTVLPRIKEILTRKDLQLRAILRLIINPWHMKNKANILAKTISSCWGINGKIKDLPLEPRWIINATTYETGKNWRFMPQRMGDYICGYVIAPELPITAAMASSAGFPVLIGPYVIKTNKFKWVRIDDINTEIKPIFDKVHLWDGGVYENLGIEALFKACKLRDGINYIIVSDASSTISIEKRNHIFAHKGLKRLINIAVDQVRSLRARQIMNFLINNPCKGLYLKMGNTAEYIAEQADVQYDEAQEYISSCMTKSDVGIVKNYKTTLRKLSSYDFDLILRHGYEVMWCTKQCYEKQHKK